jgi:putative ABC transport system permease protein
MPFYEALRLALESIRTAKLRSFFTLLGIIVSVGFLVAVVAIIQGMNAYVKENIQDAMIGTNSFQVRRLPISLGIFNDEEVRQMQKRPIISSEDAEAVRRALPDAQAVAFQSGWPTPVADITYRTRTLGNVIVFGVSPEYQVVQDYKFAAGEALSEIDMRDRRQVAILGNDIATELFGNVERAVGKPIRVGRRELVVKGVTAKKGRVLGQSFDAFALVPISTFETMFGRRKTTTISVKVARADDIPTAMARAEEALRVARGLRPGESNNFAVDKADALIAFWKNLTRVLFAVIPAVVCIGIVVGGIVIMNIMLMSVNERTHEIGIRKSLGATRTDIRRQFLVEAVVLSALGGLMGVGGGWLLAQVVALLTPLPARVTLWSVVAAMALGAGTGILFGVYPATRAARLDPITALRQE